jgi:hypothetical protein
VASGLSVAEHENIAREVVAMVERRMGSMRMTPREHDCPGGLCSHPDFMVLSTLEIGGRRFRVDIEIEALGGE